MLLASLLKKFTPQPAVSNASTRPHGSHLWPLDCPSEANLAFLVFWHCLALPLSFFPPCQSLALQTRISAFCSLCSWTPFSLPGSSRLLHSDVASGPALFSAHALHSHRLDCLTAVFSPRLSPELPDCISSCVLLLFTLLAWSGSSHLPSSAFCGLVGDGLSTRQSTVTLLTHLRPHRRSCQPLPFCPWLARITPDPAAVLALLLPSLPSQLPAASVVVVGRHPLVECWLYR